MKITSVDIIDVANDLQSSTSKWRPVVVKINTDEGICGYGEVGMAYGVGASAGFGMAKDLAKLTIGMDLMQNEAIWDKMQKKTFWGQGGGTVVSAGMSAIDIALWDIKGKALNVPVYQLLGGKCRDSVRTYASQLQFGWGKAKAKSILVEPKQYADAALQALADGYDSIKVDVNEMDEFGNVKKRNLCGPLSQKVLRVGYDRLKAMREAVGPDVDIIVEAHALTDTTSAIKFGQMIEELGVFFYEEPVMPLNPKQMKKVADNVNIPIAAGERVYTRWGFRPFFEDGSLSVIQPESNQIAGFSLYVRSETTGLPLAENRVALPMPEAGTIFRSGGTLMNGDCIWNFASVVLFFAFLMFPLKAHDFLHLFGKNPGIDGSINGGIRNLKRFFVQFGSPRYLFGRPALLHFTENIFPDIRPEKNRLSSALFLTSAI